MSLSREYPHLAFNEPLQLTHSDYYVLGQCDALIQAIKQTPILPSYYQQLMSVTLIKGGQATTAIEGNTLTIEEIERILKGEKLPPSKEYQEKEVKNILDAFTQLLKEVIIEDKWQLVTPELLLKLHKMVGNSLGEYFEAIPGKFRERDVTVGNYRCPDHSDVIPLINMYCQWLREGFRFESGSQKLSDVIIQAIAAHVYLELIHPFSDGNGRTGRLLEFYILLRGGLPNITLQILSNHYNATRNEYYKEISKVSTTKNLRGFISYAIIGLRDGLEETLKTIQKSLTELMWKNFIYDTFANVEGQKEVIKRQRILSLHFPITGSYTVTEIPKLNVEIAYNYATVSEKTLTRDLDELVSLNMLNKMEHKYSSNISILNQQLPPYKGQKGL